MARVPNLFPRIAILWLVLLIGPPSNAVYLTARDSLEEARAAIKQEHWNGAANILEAILKKEPNHAGALSLLGRVRLAQHRPAEAIVILAKALEHDPSSPEALLSLSLANEEVGNADEALSYFHQATKAGTSDPELLLRLAETGYGRGLYGDAIHALQKARALDPANEQYTLFLATPILPAAILKTVCVCCRRFSEETLEAPTVIFLEGTTFTRSGGQRKLP